MAGLTRLMGEQPERLRREIQTDDSIDMQLRRGVVCASLVGMACMAATTLLQTGVVRRLPDPKLGNFDTK